MSGICGVVDLGRGTDVGRVLDRMMPHVESAGEDPAPRVRWSLGHVALGGSSSGREPVGFAERAGTQGAAAALVCGIVSLGNGAEPFLEGGVAATRILERFAAAGPDVLLELRGEYAVAIWDGATRTLLVATDPFRTQPLFHADASGRVAFGSSLRAVRASLDDPDPELDVRSVVDVVASSVIPAPRTIYRDVAKIPAAHRLSVRDGRVELRPYWNFDFLHPSGASYDELAARLRSVLRDSVAGRIGLDGASARRVGSFLSGGIDSSTITALIGSETGDPPHCFTIGFEETAFDEMKYARIAANAIGAIHHEHIVTAADVTSILPTLVDSYEEPFANASAIPAYYCARFAVEEGVDALYAGDGGDELFAGNERYVSRRIYDRYESIPGVIRRGILEPLVMAAARRVRSPLVARAGRFVDRARAAPFDRMTAHNILRLHPVAELFRDDVVAALGPEFAPYLTDRSHYDAAPAATTLDRELYLDLKMIISDNDVIKVSRACAAAGVAVRYPFLDRVVADYAVTVPAALKTRGGRLRWFFKAAYADLLPPAIRAKRKHGFGLPIPIWLRTDPALRGMVRDLLLAADCRAASYLRPEAIRDLISRHGEDTTSFYGTILWNVVVLELFLRAHAGPPDR